jgi:hypothetical protein
MKQALDSITHDTPGRRRLRLILLFTTSLIRLSCIHTVTAYELPAHVMRTGIHSHDSCAAD